MERADFILRLAVEEDRHPDLATVGDALIAWSNALRIAGSVIVPDSVPRIELIGVEPGSQMFRVTLKKTEDFAENLKAGAADYPLVTKTAITLATLIAGAFLGAFAQNVLSHDPQTSKEQMAVLIDLDRTMHESVELQKESANFFSILQNDPAIKGVSILSDSDRETLYYVPRSDFAHRSGLWGAPEAEVYAPRQRVSRWDVTLIRAGHPH